MSATSAGARDAAVLTAANRAFYEDLWSDARLVQPSRFNTWPLVRALTADVCRRLEVAPGLRPRLPVAGTHFLDLSATAVARLRRAGGAAAVGVINAVPFPDAAFDVVCAFDIIEHVEDDESALAELARVSAPGASCLVSVPLHASAWTPFDDFVGHRRRYAPEELKQKLARHGFAVERSAAYGMQPKSSRLLDMGMWFLVHQRERAMWWYNRVFMPLGLRLQKPLALADGWIDCEDVDTVLLVCRRAGPLKPAA